VNRPGVIRRSRFAPWALALLSTCLWALGCSGGGDAGPGRRAGSNGSGATTGDSGTSGAGGGTSATGTGGAATGGGAASASAGGVASTSGSGGASGGTDGAGGTSGGQPGVTPAELVLPIERGAAFVFEFEGQSFSVDPAVGARIVDFSLDAEPILTGPDIDSSNYGSTFWSSPQNAHWNWPPPVALDSAPYTATLSDTTVVMESGEVSFAANDGTGNVSYVVSKRFSPDLVRRAIDIEYRLRNTGAGTVAIAPWEISRVPAGGLTLYPSGEVYSNSTITTQDVDGVSYVDFATAKAGTTDPNLPKLFADGTEGWIAHASGTLVFVKVFEDVGNDAQAPNEGEIEIYLGPNYEEVEQQGAYVTLEPDAESVYRVKWFLRRLGPEVDVSVGSTSLVDAVRAIVAG